MERVDLLKARIAIYRRYLREGADGDMARTYLWLIRADEIELATIAARQKNTPQPEAARMDETIRSAPSKKAKHA
jgi:hypothetical protein